MTATGPTTRYRFGVFEADPATGELRRKGVRVKLHAQPFQILLLLLDRPGEMVTREEICQELWPGETFVDYEHGVNSAINRLRQALGDAAANPRFVETLARRGYRFLAPVERIVVPSQAAPLAASIPDPPVRLAAEPHAGASLSGSLLATVEDLPKSPHSLVQTLFVLLQLMYLGFYVGALANLAEIEELLSPLPHAERVFHLTIVTAAVLIPVRIFLLCAALFHAPGFRAKILKVWWFLAPLDWLWSLAPFLLLHHIPYGLALACMTPLVYAPFAQRSLVLMGAGDGNREALPIS